jgi:hypothetical protein
MRGRVFLLAGHRYSAKDALALPRRSPANTAPPDRQHAAASRLWRTPKRDRVTYDSRTRQAEDNPTIPIEATLIQSAKNPPRTAISGGVECSLEWVMQEGHSRTRMRAPSQPSPRVIFHNVDSRSRETLNQRAKRDRPNGDSVPTLGLSDGAKTRFYEPRGAGGQAGDHRTSSGDLTSARR